MDKLIRQIPNFFTLANLFIGCMAIVYLYYDHLYIYVGGVLTAADMPRMAMASYLVFLAAGLDFLDGFLARVLRAQSAMGKQLDSLADLVTFGLVPGLMLFQLTSQAYYLSYDSFSTPIALFATGFAVTLGAAWRLARFNIDESTRSGFQGLPTPAMAMLVASLPMIALGDTTGAGELLRNKWVVIGISLVLTALMTGNLPLLALKVSRFDLRQYPWEIGGMLGGLALFFGCIFVAKLGWLSVPLCFGWYLALSLAANLSRTRAAGA